MPVDDIAHGGEFHQTASGQEKRLSATEKYLQHIQNSVSDRNAVVHKTVDEFNTTKREVEHEARWNLVKAFFGSLSPAGERFGTSVGAVQAEKESKLRAAREQFKTSMSVPLSESRGYAEGGQDIRKYVKEGGGSLSMPWGGSSGAGGGGVSRFVSSTGGGRTAADVFNTGSGRKGSTSSNDFQDKLKPVDSGKTSSGGEHTTQPSGSGQAQNGGRGVVPPQAQQNGYGSTGQQPSGQYGSPYAQGAYPSSRAGGVSSHGRSGQTMTDDELRALLASSEAPLSDTFASTGFAPSSGGGYGGGLSGVGASASSAGGGGLGAYGRTVTPASSATTSGGKISLPTTPRQGVGRTPFMPPMSGGSGGGTSKSTGNKPTVADRELIEELSQEAGLQTTNGAEKTE